MTTIFDNFIWCSFHCKLPFSQVYARQGQKSRVGHDTGPLMVHWYNNLTIFRILLMAMDQTKNSLVSMDPVYCQPCKNLTSHLCPLVCFIEQNRFTLVQVKYKRFEKDQTHKTKK